MRPGLTALTVATTLAATLLVGCSPAASDAEPSVSADPVVTASPEPAGPARPQTDVQPWTDFGDFVIDSNKAVVPTHNLSVEQRWEDHDFAYRIAGTAQARWAGSWEDNVRVEGLAREVYTKAAAEGRIGLVAYQGMRDYPCERAAGDPSLEQAYIARTEALVRTLPDSGAEAWIILEPALLPTLNTCQGDPRGVWLAAAVQMIARAGGVVYLDASSWTDGEPSQAGQYVEELIAAGVDMRYIAGFALNIGRYHSTESQIEWGNGFIDELHRRLVVAPIQGIDPGQAGPGIIIDTSRNGVPLTGPQCNPPEAGLGAPPRLVGEGVLDAAVWIKRPGESDGSCNEGLAVGQFSLAKALELARQGVHDDSALPVRSAS